MSDLTEVLQPKADQLTADDLIGGPLTIEITKVNVVKTAEQPVAVYFVGDGGKPWKPCKSMGRVLAHLWGADSSKFVGRKVTLYRDPKVKWAGLEVGGVRISHMSHIDRQQTMALTETRGSKKPYVVRPLVEEPPAPTKPTISPVEWFTNRIAILSSREDCARLLTDGTKAKAAFDRLSDEDQQAIKDLLADKMATFLAGPTMQPDDDDFPGETTPREEVV